MNKQQNMKIKDLIIMAIRGNKDLKDKLQAALGVSQPTMSRIMSENDDVLTKAVCLKVIREELKLTDAEILTELEPQN